MQNNIFFEMLPLLGFFAVYFFSKNIFAATLVCIIASWIQVILYHFVYKKISKNSWISTILITVFGGLTIILHNKLFVMLKPTILYWIFGVSLFVSAKLGKNGLKLLLNEQIKLEDRVWQQINYLWVIFFLGLGIVNLYIAFNFSEYIWVKFKVFGGLTAMLLLTIITGIVAYIKGRDRVS